MTRPAPRLGPAARSTFTARPAASRPTVAEGREPRPVHDPPTPGTQASIVPVLFGTGGVEDQSIRASSTGTSGGRTAAAARAGASRRR